MSDLRPFRVNPECDLVLERVVDVSPDLVWDAYTRPELLKQWFCPRPWTVTACEIDLRPGGRFSATMQSPEGESFPNEACYLEVIPKRRLVWTDALHPDFRPASAAVTGADGLLFTAVITLEPEGKGTRYIAHAMHANAAARQKHDEMGFNGGWSTALDQLVELMKDK